MAQDNAQGRRRARRLRLDRCDPRAAIVRRGPERAGARARQRRGPRRSTGRTTFDQDELRYMWRHHLFQNVHYSTLTFRNNVNQTALPMRQLGSFLPGHRRRRRGHPLEWPDLALARDRLQAQEPQRAALRQAGDRRTDRAGHAAELSGARALLRHVRQDLRHLGQGRQPQGRRCSPAAIRSRGRAARLIRRRRCR